MPDELALIGATRPRHRRWHGDGKRGGTRHGDAAGARAPGASGAWPSAALPWAPGFVGANVSTIPTTMTEPVRRLALPNQPAAELRAHGFGEALAQARGKHCSSRCAATRIPTASRAPSRRRTSASGMGVAQTTIGYCHEVSHRENRALVKLLGLELRKIKTRSRGRAGRLHRPRRRPRGRSRAARRRRLRGAHDRRPPPAGDAAEGALHRHAHGRRRDLDHLRRVPDGDRRPRPGHRGGSPHRDRPDARPLDRHRRLHARARRGLRTPPRRSSRSAIATSCRTCRDGSSRRRRWTSSRAR